MKTNRKPPLRIVSLAPKRNLDLVRHWREALFGWRDQMVTDVAPVGKLPKLGDCWHGDSVDEILRLKPTLVVGSVPYKQETVGKLLEQTLSLPGYEPADTR